MSHGLHPEWTSSRPTKPSDPAYALLLDDFTTTPVVHNNDCYICNDPEFAQMGLPLCTPCPRCEKHNGKGNGHIAADDTRCDYCGYDVYETHLITCMHNGQRGPRGRFAIIARSMKMPPA